MNNDKRGNYKTKGINRAKRKNSKLVETKCNADDEVNDDYDINHSPSNCQLILKQKLLFDKTKTSKADIMLNNDFDNIFLVTINRNAFYQGRDAIARSGTKFDFSIRNQLSFLKSKRPREKKILQMINIDLFNNNFKPQPSITQVSNYSLLSSLFD